MEEPTQHDEWSGHRQSTQKIIQTDDHKGEQKIQEKNGCTEKVAK